MREYVYPTVKKERRAGIELFRCVSTFLICTLHVLGQGGILSYAKSMGGIGAFRAAWLLETLAYCSVDCYALITGYVCCDRCPRPQKLVRLWAEVVFWTVSETLLCRLFFPQIPLTKDSYVRMLFPVTRKEYWYFNAYVLLFPMMPFLGEGARTLPRKQYREILLFLFGITTCLHLFSGEDIFVTGSGYSAMWLCVLYLFGAYFRRFGFPHFAKAYVTLPAFFVFGFLAWGCKMTAASLLAAGRLTDTSDLYVSLGRFVNYTSPFMVLMALCLLCFFTRLEIRGRRVRRVICLFGKCSFGVYLIHVGHLVWDNFMLWRYRDLAALPWNRLLFLVPASALGLYFFCSLVSMLRYGIFRSFEKIHPHK